MIGLIVTALIASFMTNQYAYFVFRALQGCAAAATVPSALRLIPSVFEADELTLPFALFGASGALENVTGRCLCPNGRERGVTLMK